MINNHVWLHTRPQVAQGDASTVSALVVTDALTFIVCSLFLRILFFKWNKRTYELTIYWKLMSHAASVACSKAPPLKCKIISQKNTSTEMGPYAQVVILFVLLSGAIRFL